jgi:uncharacterized protein YaaN involved in tellurite resistance
MGVSKFPGWRPLVEDVDALKARVQDLEHALSVARQTADEQTRLAKHAQESAERAWRMATRVTLPKRDE